MGPGAHRDVDILRTVSLGSTEWWGTRIHGHIVIVWVSTVWASQRSFASLVTKDKKSTMPWRMHKRKPLLLWVDCDLIEDYKMIFNIMCVSTHQVGAEPIINWLHGLAWVIGKDGTVMIISFKWWACEKRPGENLIITLTCESNTYKHNSRWLHLLFQ